MGEVVKLTTRVADSIQNMAAKLGWGAWNQFSYSRFGFDYLTRNRTELEAAYRTDWIVGMAVDIPAEDMTTAGIKYKGLDPKSEEEMHRGYDELDLWSQLCSTLKWARLFGGAGAMMMIDGQDPMTPLNIDTIGRNQFKGLLPLDRWMVVPSMTDLVYDFGQHFGKPKYYQVVSAMPGVPMFKIHYSRMLKFIGNELPYYQRQWDMYWGESVIERIHDRLLAFASTSQGTAQLVYKAHLRTYSVEGLRDIIAAGGALYEAFIKQMNLIRMWQTNEGMTVLDAKDKFEAHQYTFAGLSDVLLQFGQQISGAIEIPLVRMFGQSPAGLNSTGESDLRTYYDGIKKKQTRDLRHPITVLNDVVSMSRMGTRMPPQASFKFNSLWQISAKEQTDIANTGAQAIVGAFDANLLSQKTAMMELRALSETCGMFSNITDDEIEMADDSIPTAEDLMNNQKEIAAVGGGNVPAGDEDGDDPETDEGGGTAA